MSGEVGRHHDEEKSCSYRKDCYEVRVEAYEAANGKEGEGVGGLAPREQTLKAILKDEDHSNSI